MIRRSDWEAVLGEAIADERATLGEPPTVEEARAYLRGELTPEEEELMRARLVAYPELVQALTAPIPSEEEWRSGKVLQFWRASTALAAALALVFGALLWRGGSRREPRVLADAQELFADGQRGGASSPVTIESNGEPLVLIVPLYNPGAHARYRLEIIDAKRVVWRSGVLTRRADDAFRIETPLEKGRYQVVLYGVDGAREQRVDTYSLRVR